MPPEVIYLVVFSLFQMVSEKQQKEAAPPVLSIENNSGKKMYSLAEVCEIFYPVTHYCCSSF